MASDIEHMLSSHEPQVAVPPGFRPLISGLIKKLRLRFLVKREKKIKVFISYTDLLTQLFFVGHSVTQTHRHTHREMNTIFLKNKNRRQKSENLVKRPDM